LWITEHPEGQRYGKELWLVQKEQWAEEVIPSPVEAEDGTGDHCGLDQRVFDWNVYSWGFTLISVRIGLIPIVYMFYTDEDQVIQI
jgi:hypothetical protein